MRVRVSGDWKEITSGRVYIGGAWKNLVRIRAYIGGAWKEVATFVQPLTASVSPAVTAANRIGAGTATTSPVTITPSGGIGPYTYSCVRVTGTGGTVTSPSSATTTFRRLMGNGEVATNVFRWTVTDAMGSVVTGDCTVDFISEETGGFEP